MFTGFVKMMDGYEVARRIRAHPTLGRIQLVAWCSGMRGTLDLADDHHLPGERRGLVERSELGDL